MKFMPVIWLITILLFAVGDGTCWAAQELTEEEMDGITAAGSVSAGVADGVVRFQFSKSTPRMAVEADGDVTATETGIPGGYGITIRDSAQENLSSFINLNAVNSTIQLLINLNVTINSQIGTIKQLNLPVVY